MIVELPTYSGAIAAFHNLQASLVGVPQDARRHRDRRGRSRRRRSGDSRAGPRSSSTSRRTSRIPPGLLMSAQRRRELLDAARRHDLVILEDDPYGSIYFEDVTTLRRHAADQGRRHRRARHLPGQLLEDPRAGPARGVDGRAAGDCAEGRALQAGRRHFQRRLRSAHRPWRAGRRRHRSHRAGAARALPGQAHGHGARARARTSPAA